jgi:ubiquinone/menaquinone biosynthesis C-methylase UbiE
VAKPNPAANAISPAVPRVSQTTEGSLTFWDKVNSGRWGQYLNGIEKEAVQRANLLVGKPGVCVDMGCGSGQWASLLEGAGWSLTCIDIDEQVLAICRRNVPSANFILTNASSQSIPTVSQGADLLLCIEAPVLDTNWFLTEADRVLKEGGFFVGVWLNSFSWRSFAWRVRHLLKGNQGLRFYGGSYGKWRKKLAKAGFDVAYENGYCWGPFTRESNSWMVPIFSKAERWLGLNHWAVCSPWVVFIARKKGAG